MNFLGFNQARREGRTQLREQEQNYVDKFAIDPLPNNLSSATFRQPRFIADFTNVKKYNEFCLINTHFEKMQEDEASDDDGSSDDEDEEEEQRENVQKDKKMTDEIAWAPWYTYRVRIWLKYTKEDLKELKKPEAETESESEAESDEESSSDDTSDSDDDDDDVRERRRKRKKRLQQERTKKKLEDKQWRNEAKAKKKEIKKKKRAKKEKLQNGHFFSSKLSSDDPIGYKLVCDHFVVQNDHCFGRPTRFYWDEAIHDMSGGGMDHQFGGNLADTSLDHDWLNLDHPLYLHPGMAIENDLSGGIFSNGIAFCIGKDTPYDLISIDARVPPVAQLYNLTTKRAWVNGWGISSISPYKVWREEGEFRNGTTLYSTMFLLVS